MVAEVIINSIAKELNRTFDYIVPDSMKDTAIIGARVFVPFGKTKVEEGFIINLKKSSTFANKEILKVEDNILNEKHIELAKIMARRYFCNISDCIKLMLPPGNTTKKIGNRIKDKSANFVYLKKEIEQIELDIETEKLKSEKHIRVINFLKDNEGIYIADLEAITDVSRAVLKTLEKNGYIEIVEEKVERNPFKDRKVKRDTKLALTDEQKNAFDKIKDSKYREFLIYGVTGSRKN